MMILNPQQQAYPPLSSNNPITQAEKNKGKILPNSYNCDWNRETADGERKLEHKEE